MGRFHSWRGEKEQAIAAFEEALAFEPDNEWVQTQIRRLKQPEEDGEEEE
ncbi:MAG: hypothetical protein GY719_09710 [bacterium]|nr:hypothetical protein [bacterium]